jgi:dTDP-4-amino-4,6-dideoxygalactose transaminase
MNREIRLSKSVVGKEEMLAVMDVLNREYLGMGKDVKILEDDLTKFLGRRTLCVNTGTAALHLALQALGIKAGDEVLVQSLTYLATYQAITATGAIPIPCEVKEDTFTIDLKDAEKKVSPRTKVIMPIHYAGCPGDLDAIYEFAKKYKLRVIEDAAHGFGTTYKGKVLGGFGDIACFSFDGIKNITCGEGGGVVTDDEEVIQKVSDARLLGVQKDSEKRYAGQRSWDFEVVEQGWRFHMSNIMAAIGYTQLKKFPVFKEKRQKLAKLYQSILQDKKGIKILKHDYSEVVPHIFIVRIESKDKELVRNKLLEYGIQTGLHYKPNHLLKFFNPDKKYSLPLTEKIFSEMFTLPIHPDLNEDDIKYICEKLFSILEN